MIEFKAHSIRWNLYPALLRWPRTWDYTRQRSRENPNTTVLLKQYRNNMTSNDILPHLQITIFLRQPQRSFLLQLMGRKTEPHKRTTCREWVTLEFSVLNGESTPNPSRQISGNLREKGREIIKCQWGWRALRRLGPQSQEDWHLYKLPESPKPGKRPQPHSWPRSYLQLIILAKEKFVFSNGVSLGTQIPLKDRFHAQQ